MKIHELSASAAKLKKRVGRGIGSGKGKTAGRGTKGQNSRAGGGVRPGFEGGQNPLAKRLPLKRGFTPINKTSQASVTLSQLTKYAKNNTLTNAELVAAGVVEECDSVKVLGSGSINTAITVKLQAATATAMEAIKKAGGSFESVAVTKRAKKPSARNRNRT